MGAYTMTDLTGQRFGRLTVIAPAEDCDKEHFYPWIVRCDCGTVFTVSRYNLASGNIRSCGCLKRETMRNNRRNRKECTVAKTY